MNAHRLAPHPVACIDHCRQSHLRIDDPLKNPMPHPPAYPAPRVVFSHGRESGPWGLKITAMAEVARRRSCTVASVDYRGIDDPLARVQHLIDHETALPERAAKAPRLLVGSSMGGYVSAMACAALQPQALMLLAPALYFPGWDQQPARIPELCAVVHGWQDEIVPVERAIRFATHNRADLHIFDADHGLSSVIREINLIFDRLLERLVEHGPHKMKIDIND